LDTFSSAAPPLIASSTTSTRADDASRALHRACVRGRISAAPFDASERRATPRARRPSTRAIRAVPRKAEGTRHVAPHSNEVQRNCSTHTTVGSEGSRSGCRSGRVCTCIAE
jgi:hypothetical protein